MFPRSFSGERTLRKPFVVALSLSLLVWWIFVAAPFLTKLPEDFSFEARLISTDDFYNEALNEYKGGSYSVTDYHYTTVASSADTNIIKSFFSVYSTDNTPIYSAEHIYGIDRMSGAHVPQGADKTRSGTLFAPKKISPGESFTYWHANYDEPALMEYVGTEELYGLKVFKYRANYQGVTIDQTQNLLHLPDVGLSRGVRVEPELYLWVEPYTGSLIKYEDNSTAYYYNLETGRTIAPWNHFSNTFEPQSVVQIVNEVTLKKLWYRVVEVYIPSGLVLFVFLTLFYVTRMREIISRWYTKGRVLKVGGWLMITSGTFFFLGWFFTKLSIIYSVFNTKAINPLTAFLFILLGIGIVLSYKQRFRLMVISLGTGISILSCIHLFYLSGITVPAVDLIFFK